MAERRDRITIISVSVAIFSAMSLLCGMATNFWQILLCPVGVGIGEAGVQAPSTSLIGDHFPPHRRGFALTIMRLGAPVGSLFGSILAAWIARDHGWRAALMAICALGLIVALAFRLLLRDPPRGMGDNAPAHAAPQPPPGMGAVFGMMMRRAAFCHMLIGLALASMALYGGGAFTTPFFMRTTAAFIYFFVSTLIGLGFGLPLLGLASDRFAGHALPDFGTVCTAARLTGVCAEASSTGVRSALLASIALHAWAAAHYWFAARAIRRDTDERPERQA